MRKPCLDKEDRNKGAWSNHEDQKLIRKHGKGCCQTLPQPAAAGMLVFSYTYKRGNFSEDEEDLIIKLHALLGNRWSLIAGRLPNRTDNEVKNYWNSHLKKKLMKMGIDPNNHKLNHIPYHITNPKLSTTVASSTQKTQATGRSDGDNEVTSDGRCCFDYDKSGRVPDLNLNLSLFTMVTLKNEEGENHNCNSKVVHSPNTLLLFE